MAQLTNEQRYTIEVMLASNKKQSEIALILGRDKSVISREISRNKDQRSGQYRADLATKKCIKRQKEKRKREKFTKEIRATVLEYLEKKYSPDQITGFCKKNNIPCVSHERIYQHIWEDKRKGGQLHLSLRRQGRRYRKRGNNKDSRGIIKNRVSIEKRPQIVEERTRFGDLEIDLIIGEQHQHAILTIVDRASGMLKMKKVESKQAEVVTRAINNTLEEWAPYLHTITADNGKEFAGHQEVAEKLNVDYYFAHPYHSWERGTNENCNGLVRQYFKKGSSFLSLTDEQIKEVENEINNRPRKRFDYENPIFVMNKLLFNNKVAFVT